METLQFRPVNRAPSSTLNCMIHWYWIHVCVGAFDLLRQTAGSRGTNLMQLYQIQAKRKTPLHLPISQHSRPDL